MPTKTDISISFIDILGGLGLGAIILFVASLENSLAAKALCSEPSQITVHLWPTNGFKWQKVASKPPVAGW